MDNRVVRKKLCVASLLATLALGMPSYASENSVFKSDINRYFYNVELANSDAEINTADGAIAAIAVSDLPANPTPVYFDTNLKNSTGDTITVENPTSSTVKIYGINIMEDVEGEKTTVKLFDGANIPLIDLNDYIQYTNNSKYVIKETSPGVLEYQKYSISSNLNNAVTDAENNRVFSGTSNTLVQKDLGTLGGTELTIIGNGYDIDGNGHQGLTLTNGQSLNLNNLGSLSNDGAVKNSVHGFKNTSGGAFLSTSNADVKINNSVFSANHNSSTGTLIGGVINAYGGSLLINNSTFADNSIESVGASVYGSVLYSQNAFVNIFESNFKNNFISSDNADADGGVLFNAIGSASVMNIYGSVFKGNSASASDTSVNSTEGGAIKNYGDMKIVDTLFESNNVNGNAASGGAFFTIIEDRHQDFTNTVFKGNSATSKSLSLGGAIWASSIVSVNSSKFENNIAESREGSALGGAIYNIRNLTVSNSEFLSNHTIGPDSKGGAIYTNGSADIFNSVFSQNTAGNAGGAILNLNSVLNVHNSVFTNNQSNDLGGAISSRDSGNVTSIFDSSFVENSAQSKGGAVDIYHGVLNISGSYFENNNSGNFGGAIGIGDAQTKIVNSVFKNNTATVQGGAIYTGGILSIIADNGITEFSGNTDSTGNNAIYSGSNILFNSSKNGTIKINDKIVTNNITNSININNSGVKLLDGTTDAGTDGRIIINDSITNATLNLNGGSLILGDYGNTPTDSNGYFNNVNLNLNNGTLNAANGVNDTFNIVNLTAQNSANLALDADLKNNAYDKFNITGTASGSLNIGALNITSDYTALPTDGGKSVLNIFDSSKSPSLTVSGNTYTNDYKYYISSSSTNGALDLKQYDITGRYDIFATASTEPFMQFDFTSSIDTGQSLVLTSPTTFILNGNGFDFKGNSQRAIFDEAHDSKLIINNIGYVAPDGTIINSAHGFEGEYGAFATVYNYLQINNSVFTDNSVTIDGGAIWAGGRADIFGSYFKNNSAANAGGAIADCAAMNVFNSTFESNTALIGGAIHNYKSTLNIFDSIFTANSANRGGAINILGDAASTKINVTTFKRNTADNGGAVYNSGYLIVTDSVFGGTTNSEGNSGVLGGAIHHDGTGAKAIIDGSTFSHNLASDKGGAIYADAKMLITNSSFSSNTSSQGGAIYNAVNTLTVNNSTFNQNNASDSGGVIYTAETGILNVVDSEFTNSVASSYGGAIATRGISRIVGSRFENNYLTRTTDENGGGSVFNLGKLYITDSDFIGSSSSENKTQYGGAIWTMYDSSYLNIKDSEFSGLKVSKRGGVIYSNKGESDIYSSTFTKNSAQEMGGAIFQTGSSLNIYDSSFNNNSAADSGGAIAFMGNSTNLITTGYISGATFTNNTAANYGGAIYNNGAAVYVTDSTFGGANASDGNTAQYGGAIFNTGSSSTITIKDSLFQNNTATSDGSAIYNTDSAVLNVYNSSFISNNGGDAGASIRNNKGATANVFNSIFEGNTNNKGGAAIRNDQTNSTVNISKSTFKNNSATADSGGAIYNRSGAYPTPTTMTVKSSTFEGNSNKSGGAIYNGGTLTVYDSIFTSNRSNEVFGGAIRSDSSLDIFYSTFDSNHAKTTGGSLYANYGFNLVGSSFTNNSAETLGGAVYNNAGTAQIRDSIFTNNTASQGGAFYNAGGTTNIFYSEFKGNKSTIDTGNDNGGAIYNNSGAVINVTGGTFSDNVAQRYGGAISNRGTANIYNSSFTNNVATGNDGGGIMNFGTIKIENSYFAENTGTYGGAFRSYGGTTVITSSTFENNSTRVYNGARGGAIEFDNGGTATINTSIFRNNSTAGTNGHGGAIYNEATKLTVNNSYFSGNTTTSNGSAIYNTTVAEINGSTFLNNSAGNVGTIANIGGSLTVDGSYFGNNQSNSYGGVIYNVGGGTVSISKSIFENNKSVNMNSGVLQNSSGTVRVSDSYFANNKATDINASGSGVIEASASTVTSFTNSLFKNNASPKHEYGGVAVVYGDFSLIGDKGTTFVAGNSGSNVNGAFLVMGGGELNLNAGNGGIVRIDDRIYNSGVININKTGIKGFDGTTDAPTNGMVILNNEISANGTINFYNGILSLGSWGKTMTLPSNKLTLNGGILNLANGLFENKAMNSLEINSTTGLFLDVDPLYTKVDSLSPSAFSMGSRLALRGLNITTENNGISSAVQFDTKALLSLDGFSYAYTNDYKYMPQMSVGYDTSFYLRTNGAGGLANAAGDMGAFKSFSLTKDYNASHGSIVAGAQGSMFTIFGNKHSLNGNTSLVTQSNQTLNIFGVGEYDRTTGTVKNSWSGVASTIGTAAVEAWTTVSGVTINVSDSVFSNNSTQNGAVFALGSNNKLSVNNGVFVSNTATTSSMGVLEQTGPSTAVFVDSIFKNNTAGSYGGVIGSTSNESYLNVTSSEFTGNSAVQNGGAINYLGTSIITDSTFKGNVASKNGGTYEGGAIYNTGNMTIQKSIFGGAAAADKNRAYNGGAISNGETGVMNIYSTEFIGNSASSSGGAIINHGTMNIYNSTFTNNGANTAGAIMAIKSGTSSIITNIYNSTFTGNSAASSGVFYSSYGYFNIYNSIFNNNTATSGAGGVGQYSSRLTILDSTFNENTAATSGGVFDGFNTTLEIRKSVFKGNRSNGSSNTDGGGAISSGSDLIISDSIFGGNGANDGNSSIRGGAIFISAGTTNISNSSFIGNSASDGGAIFNKFLSDAVYTVNIDKSEFVNNTSTGLYGGAIVNGSGATTRINNSLFSGNTHTGTSSSAIGGGAAYNNANANLTITNSQFVKNTSAQNGGAVYNRGTATINNTTFGSADTSDKNSALNGGAIFNDGGTMEINYSKFFGNYASVSGGAIFVSGGKLTVNNSVFNLNTSVSGGILAFNNAAQITINSSEFTNNSSNSGLIYFNYKSGSKLTINNSVFKNNNATVSHGGVIDSGGEIVVNNSYFEGNSAKTSGGAIANDDDDVDTFTDTGSTYKNNSAASAGAIYSNGAMTLKDDKFLGNKAISGDGGAIYIGMGMVSISKSKFSNNSAGNLGGAIYNKSTLTITDSIFNENTSLIGGGAIYNNGGTITIKNSTFDSNYVSAALHGGAIGGGGTLAIEDSRFTNNRTSINSAGNNYAGAIDLNNGSLTINNSTFEKNYVNNAGTGISGGGVISGNGYFRINNSVFKDNWAKTSAGAFFHDTGDDAIVTGSSFIRNHAGVGGAIYSNSSMSFIDSTFTDNYSNGNGGAIYNAAGTMTVTDSVFKGNTTGQDGITLGDGAAIENRSILIVSGSIFGGAANAERNSSSGDGGAINNLLGTANITDSVFTNNYSAKSGGALGNGNVMNIDSSTFTKNSARNGGAIYSGASGRGNLVVTNSTFIENSATLESGSGFGGALAIFVGTANISDSVFRKNTAVSGGAIWNNATAIVSDSVFDSNNASAGGGAITNTETGILTVINSVFKNNTSASAGVIYNLGVANIIANNGITEFTGNKWNTTSRAISNQNVLNLNAGNNGKIIFNDIIAQNEDSTININQTGIKLADGITDAPTDGDIYLNNYLSSGTVNVYNGSLSLSDEKYLSVDYAANLNMAGGTLNLINNKIGTVNVKDFSSLSGSKLNIDADLTAGNGRYGQSDSITVNGTVGAGSTIALNAVNILKDGDAQHLTIFNNAISPEITTTSTYTNGGYKYTFTQNADTAGVVDVVKGEAQPSTSLSTAGFIAAIKDTSANRAFSATDDVNVREALPSMGGTTLTIFGNQHNINGNGNSRLDIRDGQVLNVYNVGSMNSDGTVKTSWNGFATGIGGALLVAGNAEANIYNSVFYNNKSTTGTSGVIKIENDSVVNIYDSTFISNSSGSAGISLTQNNSTVNVINSKFISNISSGSSGAFDIYDSSTINSVGSLFDKNTAVYNAGAVKIAENGFGNFYNTKFTNNTAGSNGGAIYSEGTLFVSGSTFDSNSAPVGGAIVNKIDSNATIVDSIFSNNKGAQGGAIVNDGTLTIRNGEFKNNIATADGAAIINQTTAVLNLIADSGKKLSFTGNSSGTNGGALLNRDGGVTEITANKGSQIIFENNYASETSGRGGAIRNWGSVGTKLNIFGDTGSIIIFKGNKAKDGGAIYNQYGIFDIKADSLTFESNSADRGAAILHNANEMTIYGDNVKFINNTAETSGGAIGILTGGILNLMTDNGVITFKGNTANGVSNAVYNEGTLNLNVGQFGKIEFNDRITSDNIANEININNSGTVEIDGTAVNRTTGGTVIFNEKVSNSTINLYNGILKLGKESYFSGTLADNTINNLLLDGGLFDIANGKIGNVIVNDFNSVSGSKINFDADLTSGVNEFGNSDSITVIGNAAGDLNINAINVIKDGYAKHLKLFTDEKSPVLNALRTYTNDAIYTFNPSMTAGVIDIDVRYSPSAGLPEAVKDTITTRSFSATADVDLAVDLGAMGGTNSTLTIFGNKHNFNGNGHKGILVTDGQTLNIYNIGSLNADGMVKTSANGFVPAAVNGSFVRVNNGKVNVSDSVFYQNEAPDNGVFYVDNAELNVSNSTFIENIARGGSGVIGTQGAAVLNVINSLFKLNSAQSSGGGVLYLKNTAKTTVEASSFQNNSALSYGGAIYNADSAELKILNSEFKENDARDGGALHNRGGVTDIKDSSFESNIAQSLGGAVYNNGTLTVDNTSFSKNKVTNGGITVGGGAIHNENGTVTVKGSVFEGNTASQYGGAIINRGSTAKMEINESLFIGNKTTSTADEDKQGGAIHNTAEMTITDSVFGGSTVDSSNTNTDANTSKAGGAIYNIGTLTIKATDGKLTKFISNSASDVGGAILSSGILNVSNALFESNSAKIGGAIRLSGSTDTQIKDTEFKGNISKNGGGAIFASNSIVNITNTLFKGNKVTEAGGGIGLGGAIYNDSNSIMTIASSTFGGDGENDANTASNSAGAIFTKSQLNITDSVFNKNTAVNSGGAITNEDILSVASSTFKNNNSGIGGAIYNYGSADITDSVFENNTASTNGGAINNIGTLNIIATDGKTTTFTNNKASGALNDIFNDAAGVLNFKGAGEIIVSGGIAGFGTINKLENGTLELSGINENYNGEIVISAGKILYNKTSDADSYLGGITKIDSNGTLEFNVSQNKEAIINGNVQSFSTADRTGNFVKSGEGVLKLTGDNSHYTGRATVADGKLLYLQSVDSDKFFGGVTTVNTDKVLEFNVNGANAVLEGQIAGDGNFIKTGADMLIVSKDNTAFAGHTTIKEGTLKYLIQGANDKYFKGDTTVESSAIFEAATDFEGTLDTVLKGNGSFIKTGAQKLNLAGDNSAFVGDVNINEGTLAFSTADDKKFFGSESVNITNAALDYKFNETGTFDKEINLKGSASLNLEAAVNSEVTVSTPFAALNDNNTVNFTNGIFIFANAMDSFGGLNNLFKFTDTTFKVADSLNEFGSLNLNAQAQNTHFNLSNGKTGNLVFNDLTLNGSDNKLSVDIDLKNNADQYLPGIDPSADKIIANTGSGTLTMDAIKIVVDGKWANKEIQLVDAGDITINNFAKYTEYTSGGYEYDISKSDSDDGSIIVSTTDYNIANTLKKAHMAQGERGFTVGTSMSRAAENVYYVLSNLESMGEGDFDVKGINKDSSTISGNHLWTLFNVDSTDGVTRALNIRDVKIANAVINADSGRTNGAALAVKGVDANASVTNTIFENNSAINGGAIYNEDGTVTLTDSILSANTSSEKGGALYNDGAGATNIVNSVLSGNKSVSSSGIAQGGAVYNKGSLNIISQTDKSTVFSSNTADGIANDIHNDNGTITFKGEGTAYINSGISGTGSIVKEESGSVNIKGLNTDYTGTTTINNGKVVFDKTSDSDTYLGGITTINKDDTKDGILEFKLAKAHNFVGENKILGNGTFLKSGNADFNISGVNEQFKGTVKIENGKMNYNQTPYGTYFGGMTTLSSEAVFNFTNSETDTINGLSGYGKFNKNGLGVAALKGDSSGFESEFASADINAGSLEFIKTTADDKFIAAIVNVTTPANLTFNLSMDEAVGGNIKGNGTLTKKGSSALILTKNNSGFVGTATIEDGRIVFNVEDEGDVYLGGKTIINSGSELVYNLSIDENFVGTNSITGEGSFVKTINPSTADDVILHVSGKNDAFKGTVQIQDGTISYEQSSNGTYFGGMTEISDGAKLDFTNTAIDTINGLKTTGAVQDGAFNKFGSGTALLKGDNSGFNGQTTINQGKLSYNKSENTDKFVNGLVLIKNGAELNIDTVIDDTINGKILGEVDGTVSKTGNGTLTLGGDNKNFLGTAKVENGTLNYVQSNSGSYLGGSTLISDGAVLKFTNNYHDENIKNISGKGIFIKEGSETLNLKGNNAGYTGTVNVNEGTLKFNDLNDTFFSSDSINVAGAAIDNRAVLDYTINGNSSVSNTINLNGNADFVLSGIANADGSGKNKITVSDAVNTNGSNNNASFKDGNFIFNNAFENFGKSGANNIVSFDNSTLQLGNSTLNFGNDKLNGNFKNSTIDLSNGKINKLTFDNLTIGNDVKMNIDLDLKDNPDQTSHVADPEADIIKYNSGSGTIKIDGIAVSVNGQWKDAEVQILDGSGITMDDFDPLTAATSSEYEYAVKKSDVAGHENTHIQITTTDYISDPTAQDYSLKRMHTGIAPDGHVIGENRSFTVDETTPVYKVLSNLGEMGKGKLDIFGKTDSQGNPIRTISGNGIWSLFNLDSTDSDSRTLNINGVKVTDASTENDTRKNGSAVNIIGEDSQSTIKFSSFENNKSEEKGGAVYNDGGKLAVENSSFSKNNAGLSGGAIHNADGTANISGTNFSENTAQSGGAIHNDSTLILQNVNFDRNSALVGNGGAIVNIDTTTITNANFTNNTSSANGGAVHNTGSFTVNNAVFIGNKAQGHGGAIYNTDSLKLYDTSFSGNSSQGKGGAIYNTGDLEINASIDKTISFVDNTANGEKNDIWTSNGLTVKGEGNVNILSGIAGSGTLNKLDSGVLNLSGKNEGFNGDAVINGGRLVFHKETADDTYINGTTTVNSGSELVYNLKVDDTIDGKVKGDGTFIKAGEAMLNLIGDNSAFTGKTDIQNGTIKYTQSTGSAYFGGDTLIQNGAALKFVNSETDNVKNISGTGSFIKQGEGILNLSGKNADFKGAAKIEEGILDYKQTSDSSYFGGSTAISENAQFKFTSDNDGTTNIENISNLSGKGTFVKDGNGTAALKGSNAEFSGRAVIENGRLKFEKTLNADSFLKGKTTINENGELEFSLYRDQVLESEIDGTGKIIKTGDSALVLNGDHTAFKGDLELKEGTLKIGKDAKIFDLNNFTMYEKTLLDLRNNSTANINIGNLILNGGVANLGLDVDLKNKIGDFVTADSVSGEGSLLIKHLNIYADGFLPNTLISVIDTKDGLSQKVSLDESLKTALGPIYRYQVSYNQATGQLNFIGGAMPVDAAFNPAVLAAPVAAQVGGYLSQLNTYEDAFGNMDMLMLLPRAEREAMRMRNLYAAADANIAFTPTMIPEQNKGGWFRPFSSFESVPLARGPKVSNVAYGSLMGVDSEIRDLGHGFEGVFSAYAGYNGSQQRYQGVSISQNGGVLGGTLVAYRGNFFSGLTANVGANQAQASTMYGSDDFTMLMAGIASKSGYNWELNNGKFVVQPNLMMSYTFVNTFDFTNAAGVRISSDPLNAIQVAPGVKFIGNLKNGWQPYASVSVIMNFMDKAKFHANDVTLPEMAVKPYVMYGVGVQKRWGERFTGFIQTMLRSGGRNGVGFQLGFRWSI